MLKITTPLGVMTATLYDETPLHKENFLKLVDEKFFDGTLFHRIIPRFMIQGGDPLSKNPEDKNIGKGGPGYTIPNEIKPELKHSYGTIAAARMADQVNPKRESSGSQFYIVNHPMGVPFLDGQYTVFGKITDGFDVLDALSKVKTNSIDRPLKPLTMTIERIEE